MLFKRSDTRKTSLKIGEKTVHARRITIAQWRELIDSIQMIPQMIVTVLTAHPSERAGFFVVAVRESFDDIVRVTSILTGVDEEYIEQNASVDQLAAFYKAVVDENNFGELLKNGQGVLSMITPKVTEEAQDAS